VLTLPNPDAAQADFQASECVDLGGTLQCPFRGHRRQEVNRPRRSRCEDPSLVAAGQPSGWIVNRLDNEPTIPEFVIVSGDEFVSGRPYQEFLPWTLSLGWW
jgi:hypothetical protein